MQQPSRPWSIALTAFVLSPLLTSGRTVTAQSQGLIDSVPSCYPLTNPDHPDYLLQRNYVPATQYIEGADAIRLDNGDVVLLCNLGFPSGAGQYDGGGEGIFALRYPASSAERPRWYPIYSGNNWSDLQNGNPAICDGGLSGALHEHENAFPFARFFNGSWHYFWTSTPDKEFWPCNISDQRFERCTQNDDRLALADALLPYYQPASASRRQWWLQPLDPPVQSSTSFGAAPRCLPSDAHNAYWDAYGWQTAWRAGQKRLDVASDWVGMGSGTGFGNGCVGLDGNLYIYHNDGNSALCGANPSRGVGGYLRHKVNPADMSPINPQCVSVPTDVFDVATGWDATPETGAPRYRYFALGNADIWRAPVKEFVSDDGLTFIEKRSDIAHLDCGVLGTTAPNCFVTDVSYLKDKTGRVILPRVLVGVVGRSRGHDAHYPDDQPVYLDCTTAYLQEFGRCPGDGSPGAEGVFTNTWRFYFWADGGATLPPTWGQAPASCPAPYVAAGAGPVYQGNLDTVDSEAVTGWAWDWYQPYGSVSVDLYDGATKIVTAVANQHSAGLAGLESATTTFGNANHAYSLTIPHSLVDGTNHTLTVKYGGTSMVISNGVQTFNRTPIYGGNHDTTDCFTVSGWVWDSVQPNTPINADIYDGTTLLATVLADQNRRDLPGNGSHGFIYTLPASVRDGQTHTIYIRYGGTAIATWNSPRQINCALSFFTITPCRVFDSRTGGYRLGANQIWNIQVSGVCGIPATALAVALNTTIVSPVVASGFGNLDAFPLGISAPGTTAATVRNGVTRATFGIHFLGINGQLSLQTSMAAGSSTDAVLDVSGYFAHP